MSNSRWFFFSLLHRVRPIVVGLASKFAGLRLVHASLLAAVLVLGANASAQESGSILAEPADDIMRFLDSSGSHARGRASGDKIANPLAVFSGLDKITGRIIEFDVAIDETVQFGALRVTPRVCYTRPPHLPRRTTGFIEVEELTLDNQIKRIFTGWMFAASPGLNAVEHPIYDIWLKDCKVSAGVRPPVSE